MTDDPKSRAEALLVSALDGPGAPADPRPLFRPVLRHLRERHPAAFARAIGHFEETLVPSVAGGADPLRAWLDYGLLLASAVGPGQMVEVDRSGRARPVEDVAAAQGLVLHIPEAEDAPVLVLRQPAVGSSAQVATVELLVAGRVTASAYG